MPLIAHIGVGFAAKKAAPKIPVVYLILAAEFIEILSVVFWIAGIEHQPIRNTASFLPYSHSIVMGFVWSVLAALTIYLVFRDKRLAFLIGMLVLSHTVLDFIAAPKTAFYRYDTGLPIFLNTSNLVGLGLWENLTVGLLGEFGFLFMGLFIYIKTIKKINCISLKLNAECIE